jgi:hypothetical protein
VVVDQGAEAVLLAVPDVPDEGAVVEELAVVLEEGVAEPLLDGGRGLLVLVELGGGGEELVLPRVAPPPRLAPEGGGEEAAQAIGGGGLGAEGRQADDAVVVGVVGQLGAAVDQRAGLGGEPHLLVELGRPAVADEPGDADLQRRVRLGPLRTPVEEPLRRVVRLRLGEPVGVLLRRDPLPMIAIVSNTEEGAVCDTELLVKCPNVFCELIGSAIAPYSP